MKKIIMIILCFIFAAMCLGGCANTEKETEKNENQIYPEKTDMITDSQLYKGGDVQFPNSLWQTPESERYEALDNGYAKGYFIKSVNNTYVFCFVGIPDNASAENKVPGVVLVHGGGGTAFYEWVNYWVNRGYAAVAMDTDGNMPTSESLVSNNIHANSIKACGPENSGFADSSKAISEQWAYNGIASTIVSDSFLRSFKEVDVNRICITGISYGSFLTSQAVIYDDRYIGAVSVYGSLGQKDTASWWAGLIKNQRTSELWDDASLLQNSKTPILYISSSNDTSFSLEALLNAVPYSKYVQTSIKYNFNHSHHDGIFNVLECNAFIDNICKKTTPLIQIKEVSGDFEGTVKIEIPSGVTVSSVNIYYSTDSSLKKDTSWYRTKCKVEGIEIKYSLEIDVKLAFLNIMDSRGNVISTNLIDLR